MKFLTILFGVCLGSVVAFAQQTGSFNTTITFNSETRTLSNYVPPTYNASQSYTLIVGLHGLGDNSTNYRNALVGSLAFAAAFPDAILVCPDGGSDQGKDFYAPAGDEGIILEAIQYASANYNIDPSKIILQGFSLGGRSALRYGLDNPTKFKALLLNTPAIQGVKEAGNGSAIVQYNFANASQLPIYITVGKSDAIYVEPINLVVAHLVENNAGVAYKQFNGGHTIPNFQAYPYSEFFNQPYSSGEDAGLYSVTTPVRSCNGNISATVLLQNTGNTVLDSVKLAYGIGSGKDSFTWKGNLATNAHTKVTLPNYQVGTVNTNTYDFHVNVVSLNQGVTDTFTDFNTDTGKVHVMKTALALPFEERFNTTADIEKWGFKNSGDYILPFDYTQTDGAPFTFNTIFLFDNSGTREEMLSPNLNFTGQSNVYLHFKVDYNYTKYTAAVLGIDTTFADTLEVLVSTDCGASYSSVFKKTGADLSGHNAPILNPLNLEQVAMGVDAGKYRGFNVDVSQYAGQANVHFKFSYISALGGYIYLDDVVVNNNPASAEKVAIAQPQIKVYPNPASGYVNISSVTEDINEVQIVNVLGQVMYSIKDIAANNKTIDISNLPEGAYWIKVLTNEQEFTDKIIVQ